MLILSLTFWNLEKMKKPKLSKGNIVQRIFADAIKLQKEGNMPKTKKTTKKKTKTTKTTAKPKKTWYGK